MEAAFWKRISHQVKSVDVYEQFENKETIIISVLILNMIAHWNPRCLYKQNMEGLVRFGKTHQPVRLFHHLGCACGFDRVIPMNGLTYNSTFPGKIDIPFPRPPKKYRSSQKRVITNGLPKGTRRHKT